MNIRIGHKREANYVARTLQKWCCTPCHILQKWIILGISDTYPSAFLKSPSNLACKSLSQSKRALKMIISIVIHEDMSLWSISILAFTQSMKTCGIQNNWKSIYSKHFDIWIYKSINYNINSHKCEKKYLNITAM